MAIERKAEETKSSLRKQLDRVARVPKPLWIILIGILIGLALWKVPVWQVKEYRAQMEGVDTSAADPKEVPKLKMELERDLIAAENNARTTLAQIIGGAVVLVGVYFTWRNIGIADQNIRIGQQNIGIAHENVRVTEEGKLTERFSKAVELLGSDKLDMCLGGIYALERIARDSEKDHWTVMEVLTAFVRERSKAASSGGGPRPVSTDVKAAVSVIGRRKWEQDRDNQRLDFRQADLTGADFNGAYLNGANFNGAYLDRADFTGASLIKADLKNASLIGTNLVRANLSEAALREANLTGALLLFAILKRSTLYKANLGGARLEWADFSEANLSGASFNAAFLRGTLLTGADLRGVNLSGTRELSSEQISQALTDESTLRPAKLQAVGAPGSGEAEPKVEGGESGPSHSGDRERSPEQEVPSPGCKD